MTVGRAADALDAVQREPRRALDLAEGLLAGDDLEPGERAGALWALGRAQSELDRPVDAAGTLERSIGLAEEAGLSELAAEIRVSRSVCLMTAGDPAAARRELARAEAHLTGGPLGRLRMQRALLELHAGQLESSLAGFDAALPLLEEADDRLATCRLLANRAVVLTYRGDTGRAERDLVACEALAVELGQHLVAAGATHNLGYLRGRCGDIPAALESFERARTAYEQLGMPDRLATSLETDLCGVLLAGGLHREAAAAAQRAEEAAARGGNRLAEAEATLMRAQAQLAQRDPDAEGTALAAAQAFRAVDREPWAAYAEHVALDAAASAGTEDSATLLDRAVSLADVLDEQGWRAEAVEVRTAAGRRALEIGEIATARALLERAGADRHRGTASVRARGWLATASLRLAEGDRGGARRALAAGMRVVDDHRASLGATELRTRASRHATDLAELGLVMAVEDHRAVELLRWAEHWHAGAMALAPVRPPRDGQVASLLADLRALHADIRAAALAGEDAAAERGAVARLETRIRDASRATAGTGGSSEELDPRHLRSELEGAPATTLVELVVVDSVLRAVVVTPERCRAVALGPLAEIRDALAPLLAAIRRLAVGRTGRRGQEGAVRAIEEIGGDLDETLVAPLRLPQSGPLVVVPTAGLQMLPWSVLPSLTDRALTVAPSALIWGRASPDAVEGRSTRGRRRVALVSGPDLDHARREVEAIAGLWRRPVVLHDPAATAEDVLDAMEGAQTVHVAAHGVFRADSPLFSALQVSDGPLTVYDLEHLARAPRLVVLPACDAGMSSVHGGDELLGTAAALLSVGVTSVIAPLTVVSDEGVVALMVDLHEELRRGTSPAAALAGARRTAIDRARPVDVAAAHSFVAIGAKGT